MPIMLVAGRAHPDDLVQGGARDVLGPVSGAGRIAGIANMLADKGRSWATVIIGTTFVVFVLAFRRSMAGGVFAYLARGLG